jgi:hypothetical protein
MNRVCRAIEASAGGEQYGQFTRLTCEYLEYELSIINPRVTYILKYHRHQDSEPPVYHDISEYLHFKSRNAGGYFVMAMTRIALDIYLTDDELRNPLIAQCEKLAIGAWIVLALEMAWQTFPQTRPHWRTVNPYVYPVSTSSLPQMWDRMKKNCKRIRWA